MDCIYSDDMGATWSTPQTIPMQRSPYDHPDPDGALQLDRLAEADPRPAGHAGSPASPAGSARPCAAAARARPGPPGDRRRVHALREHRRQPRAAGHRDHLLGLGRPGAARAALRRPAAQHRPGAEPRAPARQAAVLRDAHDDRLHLVQPLRRRRRYLVQPAPAAAPDHGLPILEPLCCCPIYEYSPTAGTSCCTTTTTAGSTAASPRTRNVNRRPAFIALGEFRPDAEQPIWFSESKQLMDNDGVEHRPAEAASTSASTRASPTATATTCSGTPTASSSCSASGSRPSGWLICTCPSEPRVSGAPTWGARTGKEWSSDW